MGQVSGNFLILVSAAAFGALPIFATFAYKTEITIPSLLFFRFFIAFIVMLPMAMIQNQPFPRGKDLYILMAMGFIGYAGQSYCYFTALSLLSASLVATLLYLYPVMVAVLSILFFNEHMNRTKGFALFLALGGTLLVVGFEAGSDPRGIGLALLAALVYSLYIITGARVMKQNHALPASCVIMGSAGFFYFLYSLKSGFALAPPPGAGLSVLAIALVSTVLAISTFFAGIKRVGPVNASMLSTFEAVTTVVLAFLVFGQPVGLLQSVGIFLVLSSAVMVAKDGGKRR